jgi:hypothetical protein
MAGTRAEYSEAVELRRLLQVRPLEVRLLEVRLLEVRLL